MSNGVKGERTGRLKGVLKKYELLDAIMGLRNPLFPELSK
jgi:hypothetical protein